MLEEFYSSLQKKIPDGLVQENYCLRDIIYLISTTNNLRSLLEFLRDHDDLAFTMLTDLSCVDYLSKSGYFEVVYNLLSIRKNVRIIVKVRIAENVEIPSISDIYSASIWYEREVFDMYGVVFANSPDLRRILTDYGFEGHPLRKDFPVTGYKEVRYDDVSKKVIYENIALAQQYRDFDFLSPWDGTDYILPGDEKATK